MGLIIYLKVFNYVEDQKLISINIFDLTQVGICNDPLAEV